MFPFLATPPSQKASKPSTTAVITPRRYRKKNSDDHLIFSRQPHHQVCRPLIDPLEETPAPAGSPRAGSLSNGNHHASTRGWRVGGSLTIGFHLRFCRPPTSPFHYPTLTFEPCNYVFQTLFVRQPFFFFFCLSSLISLRSRGVLRIVGPSSFQCSVFRGKVVLFLARYYFSSIFRIFRGLFELRSAPMTNKKPSRGVVCHYCHNPGHVRRNCRKLQNKNQRFQSVHYQKSLKFASTSITTLA